MCQLYHPTVFRNNRNLNRRKDEKCLSNFSPIRFNEIRIPKHEGRTMKANYQNRLAMRQQANIIVITVLFSVSVFMLTVEAIA